MSLIEPKSFTDIHVSVQAKIRRKLNVLPPQYTPKPFSPKTLGFSVACGKFFVDRGVGAGTITAELSLDGTAARNYKNPALRSTIRGAANCWGRCLPWTGLTQPRQTDPQPGVALRRERECKRLPAGSQAACASPSDRAFRRGSTGELCALETAKMKHFCVELKVCEGCGGLWIRARNHGVYCRSCALLLSEFPPPRGRSKAGRKRKLRLALCEGRTK